MDDDISRTWAAYRAAEKRLDRCRDADSEAIVAERLARHAVDAAFGAWLSAVHMELLAHPELARPLELEHAGADGAASLGAA